MRRPFNCPACLGQSVNDVWPQPQPPGCGHARPLWALCQRMLLLTAVVLLGRVALAVVLALSLLPPFCAVSLVITGRYLFAFLTLGLWLVWLRFGKRVRRLVFDGFEHASL